MASTIDVIQSLPIKCKRNNYFYFDEIISQYVYINDICLLLIYLYSRKILNIGTCFQLVSLNFLIPGNDV